MTNKPIDWTKPLRRKNGTKVRLVGTIANSIYPRVVTLVKDNGTEDDAIPYTESGMYLAGDPDHSFNLENVPERIRHETWVNVYRDAPVGCWATKEIADTYKSLGRLACVKMTIDCEVGEGL